MQVVEKNLPREKLDADGEEAVSVWKQLRESESRFQVMADSAPVLLWMSGIDSECHFFNQSWLKFTGRRMEDEMGVGWAEGVYHEDLQRVLDHYMAHFYRRQPFEMEYRLRRHDGEYRWILDRGVPRYAPEGDFVGFIGSCIDITDHKVAMESLKRLADDLLRSNQELERFAHVASHDLKEPIRSVVNYAELLAEEYSDKLGAEAKIWMGRMIAEGKRMRALIEDWLSFSRLGKTVEIFKTVDCGDIVREVLESLQLSIAETGAKIQILSLPQVMGNYMMLVTVFQNLLSNALKYHHPDLPPVVTLTAKRKSEEWIFCVEDNGIGFDMAYKDEIFLIFRRLHKKPAFPGTGLGLSICKKIVESHRGRIWAESEPGRGSRFYFSLPAAVEEEKGKL